jgi:betaine-homocysteine S-methyltransferase
MTARYGPGLEERLASGGVLGAEGYVFELERRGYIQAGPFVPEVVLEFPEAVLELHREFARAGTDVMVALTYYAHREKLRQVGREGDLEKMNRKAVQLANQAAQEFGSLVAGNICNTWAYDPNDHDRTAKDVRAMYEEQLSWAVEEGIDMVIAETNDYLGEARIALEVIKELGLPSVVTMSTVQPDKTRDGVDYIEATRILSDEGATVVGFNCDRGPATLLPLVRRLRETVTTPIAAQPVPYRTGAAANTFETFKNEAGQNSFPIELDPFLCTRGEMARFAIEAQQIGVDYIGICCGGAPHHVRAMAEALGRKPIAGRYSPDMDLHPMFIENVKERDSQFATDWNA